MSKMVAFKTLALILSVVALVHQPTECQALLRLKLLKNPLDTDQALVDDLVQQHFAQIEQQRDTQEPGQAQKGPRAGRQRLSSYSLSPYVGEVAIGWPEQVFRVLFDTNSCYLWVPSAMCMTMHCKTRNSYDSALSKTYEADDNEFKVAYLEGTKIDGLASQDRVALAGRPIKAQVFLEALKMEGDIFEQLPFDGVFGLSFTDLFNNNVVTPMKNLELQNRLPASLVSFHIQHNANNTSDQTGELILGEIDHSLYEGEIHWVRVTRARQWEFRMDKVALRHANGTELIEACSGGCSALLETGMGLIGGFRNEMERIQEAVGASPKSDEIAIVDNCEPKTMPELVVTIGGREFVVPAERYTRNYTQLRGRKRTCLVEFRQLTPAKYNHWMLGGNFLRNFYLILDYRGKRFGLATLKRS